MNQNPDSNKPDKNENPKTIQDARKDFNNMINTYLESNPILKTGPKDFKNEDKELELRFGSNQHLSKKLTKIDYDNVIKVLYSCGFKPNNIDGIDMLRIRPQYTDKENGYMKNSNTRIEIVGNYLIKEYCKSNSIKALISLPSFNDDNLLFTIKKKARIDDKVIESVDVKEFNFRSSFQTERNFRSHSSRSKDIISGWNDDKKTFRYINRVRFSHTEFPLFVDMSIVKSSNTKNGTQIPKFTIQESNVLNNKEEYEIEIELNNADDRIAYYNKDNAEFAINAIKKSIRMVLSGLQNTKFPISYFEINALKVEYFKLIYGKDIEIPDEINYTHFIGPSSVTLQTEHITENSEKSILKNYTVTDKADGDRHLLFINKIGKIYMIDKNLDIIFTGANSSNKKVFNTIFDGEFIKYDKNNNQLNLYACFDIYYINGTNVRHLPFTYSDTDDTTDADLIDVKKTRLQYLNNVIDIIGINSIIGNTDKPAHFNIQSKIFYSTAENSIFNGCSTILSNMTDSVYKYNTDGLIFTPSDYPVGGEELNKPGPLKKYTWVKSFKWKPPKFNTIDFLVTVKKDETKKDEIKNVFVDGTSLDKEQTIVQYKTLILMCGNNEKTHGYANPYQDIISNNMPNPDYNKNKNDKGVYKPVPFIPSNPYDENACFCNIKLVNNNNKTYMLTEENEYFEENMIVEFYYDKTKEDLFKWVPLRVRYDKTAALRATGKEFGNPCYVANDNWHTIHFPITEQMLSTGENISDINNMNDVYYNKNVNDTITTQLRNTHNYIKKHLINSVSNRNNTLIDYSVGMGGDLHKWNSAKLSFVYGLDISPDNIHNPKTGVCARYLNSYKKNPNLPKVLFSVAKTHLSIADGAAFDNDKDKQIANALFGKGPKDKKLLGEGVYNNYGVANKGFDIGSSQFTLHYYFETPTTLHTFLKNISDTIKVNGYFIGTCFDGKTVFDKLSSNTIDTGFSIYENETKMFEINKLYSKTGFPDDHTSIGYPISVYQESINQDLIEYLVNFEYFTQIMEDYGFSLLPNDEAKQLGIFKSTAMFSDYYDYLKSDPYLSNDFKKQYKDSVNMSISEKKISFLNRYFIFKKVRNVDTNKVNKVLINSSSIEIEKTEDVSMEEETPIVNIKPIAKKLNKKKIAL